MFSDRQQVQGGGSDQLVFEREMPRRLRIAGSSGDNDLKHRSPVGNQLGAEPLVPVVENGDRGLVPAGELTRPPAHEAESLSRAGRREKHDGRLLT